VTFTFIIIIIIIIINKMMRKCTALRFSRQFLLLLFVNVGWIRIIVLGNKDGRETGQVDRRKEVQGKCENLLNFVVVLLIAFRAKNV
jgi:hypothetical protein